MEKKTTQGNIFGDFKSIMTKGKAPLICLIGLITYVIISIVVSILALHLTIVPVCVFVILEALLAAFLNKIPVWVHGLVIITQVVLGIIASQLIFMILMLVIYVVAVGFLYLWSANE